LVEKEIKMSDSIFRFPRPASAPQPYPRPVQWRLGYRIAANVNESILGKELQASINEAVRNHYAAMERAMFTVAQETAPGISSAALLEQLRGLADKYPPIDPISHVHTHPDNTWLAQNMLRQAGVDARSIHLDFGPSLRQEPEPEQPVEPSQAADAETVDDCINSDGSSVQERLERLQGGVTVAVRLWMPRDAMLCVTRSGAYQWVVNIDWKGERK
jgi:hypothetical protein